jgi:isoquinoline 1-oxidoreductase beta subunit
MKRRNFIKLSGIAGGGLLLSTLLPGKNLLANPPNDAWQPNLFIKITPDNIVTIISTEMEIGQGTSTGLGQIIADELGANWDTLHIETNNGNAKKYGEWTGTGGSDGIARNWAPLRKAAAAVREVLIKAAAQQWNTDIDRCYTDDGFVKLRNTSQQIPFGDLTTEAAHLQLPEAPTLKAKSEYKLIGKSAVGPKQRKIVTGTNEYSLDIDLPNMVYASIERVPVLGGKVNFFDDTEARKVSGILDVYAYEGTAQSSDNGYLGGARAGVVVVANSTWAAIQGREKLEVDWDFGELANKGSSDVEKELIKDLSVKKERTNTVGDPDSFLKNQEEINEFSYLNGFQANVCMEPLNAVADVDSDHAEIWVGTQAPNLLQLRISKMLNIPEKEVIVHTQPAGGGFGRRFYSDYAEEAVLISRKVGKPVKMMWTREDTVQTNRYHDFYLQNWKGLLDENKKIIAADYKGHLSRSNAFGAWAYDIPHFGMGSAKAEKYINAGVSWRSVSAHQWVWGMESFMDEMAHKAEVDPIQFRLNHLNETKIIPQKNGYVLEDLYPGRLKECLNVVADKGKWGRTMKQGSGQGVAVCSYNTSYCALMAEVTVNSGALTIYKIVASIDCGMAINPSQVKAQIEGSIVWGITALLSEITIEKGKVQQSNYHDYPMLRMQETPEIEVYIIENEFAPSGTGEPAVPVVAPAVLNAIFAATGKRIRRIPIDMKELA